jgi:hypothetical protein
MNEIYHWIGFIVFWLAAIAAMMAVVGGLWMTFGPFRDNWKNPQ